jgi:glycopeptide antibiotics resistance protein
VSQAPSTRAPGEATGAAGAGPRSAGGVAGAPGPTGTVALAALGRRGSRVPWAVALGAYTVVVALVVGWPTPVDAGAHDQLTSIFARLHAAGVPGWFDYAFLEKAANVAMFVPFGLLITGLDRRRWWWGLLVPAALSAAAEVSQLVLRPERFATWTDVAANTAGAALGVVVALVLTARGRSARTASRRRP